MAGWGALASGLASPLSESRTNRTNRYVIFIGYVGPGRAERERMREFTHLDQCAAYAAARAALIAVQRITSSWPSGLAELARHAAADAVRVTAAALSYRPGSADRRRCLRDAIVSAINVAALIEDAGAMGATCVDAASLEHTQRIAGRSIALLGICLRDNEPPAPGDPAQPNAKRGMSRRSSITRPRSCPATNARS
jgi:hypothetical protein